MKKYKHIITACLALALAIAVMWITGANFLRARQVPLPEKGPGVTEVKMLSNWFHDLEGTNGDTPVYILKGEEDGGSMLILGGTHANECSGYLSAFLFIETAAVHKGTVYVIPYANFSAMTHNDPGEGNLQYFTIKTPSGDRVFRYGSRATNPVDQWPDPNVYVQFPSGQMLSGSETRNLNRAYPGKEDGNLTEKIAYGITSLVKTEKIDITFDLHEASPEYPVINATVAHQNAMAVASEGYLNLIAEGIEMNLEQSPTNFHGLSHRELGDYTNTMALLMETANASQGRLRGASGEEQVLGGQDKFYEQSETLGLLYVPWKSTGGHPIEERCGRHLQGIYEYSRAYGNLNPGREIVYDKVPGYEELYLNADRSMLGGDWLGGFLK